MSELSDASKRAFMTEHAEAIDAMCGAQQQGPESEWKHTEYEMRVIAENSALQARVAELGTQVTALQTVNGVLRDRVAELERELAAARARIEAQAGAVDQAHDVRCAALRESKALRAAIDAAVVELETTTAFLPEHLTHKGVLSALSLLRAAQKAAT